MNRLGCALIAIALWLLLAPQAILAEHEKNDAVTDDEWATIIGLRTVSAVFETYKEQHGEYPETDGEILELDAGLRRSLGEPFSSAVPMEDGWGTPFFYTATDKQIVIISAGPDGVVMDEDEVQALFAPRRGERLRRRQRLRWLDNDDVVLIGTKIAKRSLTNHERQLVTMANMRTVATTLEAYSVDHERYPIPPGRFAGVETLRGSLEPVYVASLPGVDTWGNEFRVWSDGQNYVVVSFGADGRPDRDYRFMKKPLAEMEGLGPFADGNRDLVFADGEFHAWPREQNP